MGNLAAHAERIMQRMGTAGVYTPLGGEPFDAVGIVLRDINKGIRGFESAPVTQQTEITFLASLVTAPRRGDAFESDGTTYRIEAPERNDGFFVTVRVK